MVEHKTAVNQFISHGNRKKKPIEPEQTCKVLVNNSPISILNYFIFSKPSIIFVHLPNAKKCTNMPLKGFIFYAQGDESYKNELLKQLKPLQLQGIFAAWHDRQIKAGLWQAQIETAMQEADVFLFVVSPNFLASDYIASKEIIYAYKRFKEQKAVIFPILADSCEWQDMPLSYTEKRMHPTLGEKYIWLGTLQAFPADAKPISNWTNPNDAYLNVVNALKNYITQGGIKNETHHHQSDSYELSSEEKQHLDEANAEYEASVGKNIPEEEVMNAIKEALKNGIQP